MLRFLFAILLCLSFLSGCGGQEFIGHKPVTPAKVQKIEWREHSNTAFLASQNTNKPALLYFSLKGCSGCKLMAAETLSDPAVAYIINENFIPVSINFDQDLLEKYKVEDFPTVLILSSADRSEIVRVGKAMSSAELIPYLRVALRINSLTTMTNILDMLNVGDLDYGPL